MPIKQLIAPAGPAIDIVEARLHVRQDITDDDAKLNTLVRAVAGIAEAVTWRSIIATRWQQSLDAFPGCSLSGVQPGAAYSLPGQAILLERSPLIQLVSIQYLDMAGVWQTMPDTDYALDDSGPAPRITPVFGKIWPIALPQIGAVKLTYDAGFAAPLVASGNNLTVKGWKSLALNDAVRLSNSGGVLPAPLQAETDYYVAAIPQSGVYQLSATIGGAVISLTNTGSGTHYLGVVPEDIKTWMLTRLDSFYDHRGDAAIAEGKFSPLPWVDSLLDRHRVML